MATTEQSSITIPGVPVSIPRGRYMELIRSLGLDPHGITWIRFDVDGITAETIARDENGRVFDGGPNELAKHLIRIKIDD